MRGSRWLVSLSVLGILLAPGAGSADRSPNLKRGSCDGLMDYADELNPDQIQLLQETVLGGGLSRVEVSMQLTNVDRGRFRSASAFPRIDPANNPLGVVLDPPPTEADFGAIDPEGSAIATAALSLTLPSANVQALIDQLQNGTIPIGVHADEETVYPDGTMIRNWDNLPWAGWDDRYRAVGPQFSVDSEPPYEPGAIYDLIFFDPTDVAAPILPPDARPTYTGDAGDGAGVLALDETICAGAIAAGFGPCYSAARGDAPLYMTPGDDPLYGLPTSVHYGRVLLITADRTIRNGAPVDYLLVQLERTDTASLPELVNSGSFCTGPEHQIDPPVSETPLQNVDDDPVPIEISVGKGQQIRFNYVPWDDGRLVMSGQIGCHALKPSVALRIRDGRVRADAGIETDCNLTAEMRAEGDVEVEEYQEPIEMWSHCFPLPSLPVGPNGIPMTFQLKHFIDVSVGAGAGAVVGFSQNYRLGYSVSCEAGGGDPAACTTETRENPVTTDFTPPQLTDETNVSMQAKTSLEAALRMGFEYVPGFDVSCELGAGLTLESGLWAELAVQPTFDPWWEATYGYEVIGGADLGIYGLGLVSAEVELLQDEIPITDAGGPLLGGVLGGGQARSAAPLARAAAAANAEAELVSGADQRWSVAIDDTALPNGVNVSSIAALPDGSSIALAGESIGGRGRIVKLDRFGAFEWAKRYAIGKQPQKVRTLSDGSVIVAGQPAWLARHDADGNLLWSFDATVARPNATSAPCYLRDVVPIETAPGAYDYVGVGSIGAAAATGHDGCALRVEGDGDVAWSKVYEADDLQYFSGATLLRDGDLAVVGEAYVNLFGNRSMPLVLKIDAANGEVVWARGMPMLRLARLNAVAEGPDGTIFAAGAAGRIIWQTGAALVAAIDADGENARHGLLMQDAYWEHQLEFEEFVATSGGNTPYDEFFDIEPQGDGFIVVGRSGLGTVTDAWAAKVNQKLGLEWFRAWDGGSTDALAAIDVADDGIFVSGWSASLPEPDGPNTGENQLWVMKLPFDGSVVLRENADVTTRFLQPGMRFSSVDPLVSTVDPETELAFTAVDAAVTSNAADPNLATTAANQCAERLTFSGHPSTLDGCIEDADDDLVADADDNCAFVANADQRDTDADAFGNACDGDLDQNGAIDDADRLLLAASFGLSEGNGGFDSDADLDGDGAVGVVDFAMLRAMQGDAPGDGWFWPAPDAQDAPIVELVFPATGSNAIEVESGALVTVQVVVAPGTSGIAAYSLSLDFGDGLVFDSATELLPAGFDFALDTAFAVGGASVSACDAATLGAGVSGAPFVACEITFTATSGAGLAVGLRENVDGIVSATGADLSEQTAFVPATVELVPEPAALASGLAALAAIAGVRRRT